LDLTSNISIITLYRATALASQVTEVLSYCTCKHTSTCQTRYLKCFKSGRKCTNYCHQHIHHLDNQAGSCLNLAVTVERNTRTLIPCRPISVQSLSPLTLSSACTPLHSPSSGSPISESSIIQFPEVPSVPSVPGPPIIRKDQSWCLSSSISESAPAPSVAPAAPAPARVLRKRA